MFGLSKPKKRAIQTPIGDGTSEPDSKHGEILEVRRYNRGAVIEFSWHPSLPSAKQVPEVAAGIQTYIERALDMIDADEEFRATVSGYGGIFPIGVYWGATTATSPSRSDMLVGTTASSASSSVTA